MIGQIGKGSNSKVYHVIIGTSYAFKKLRKTDEIGIPSFLREVSALSKLANAPNIIRLCGIKLTKKEQGYYTPKMEMDLG